MQEQEAGVVEVSVEEKQRAKKALLDVATEYNAPINKPRFTVKVERFNQQELGDFTNQSNLPSDPQMSLSEKIFGKKLSRVTGKVGGAIKEARKKNIEKNIEKRRKAKEYRKYYEEQKFKAKVRERVNEEERANKRSEPFHPDNPLAPWGNANVFSPPTDAIIFEPQYQHQTLRHPIFSQQIIPTSDNAYSRARKQTRPQQKQQHVSETLSNPMIEMMASYSSNGKKRKGVRMKVLPPWL